MANVTVTSNGKENKSEYEVRSPLTFRRNEDGKKDGLQLQTPILKKDDSKEFEIRSPVTTEDTDDGKRVDLRSPIKENKDEENSRVTITRP